MESDVKKILFVCTGNSCRSVMAEGLLRHLLHQRNRDDIRVLSAGTNAVVGFGASAETVAVMKTHRIDVASHSAQPVTSTLIRGADLILCMEKAHRDDLLEMVPDAKEKTFLLKTFPDLPNEADPNINIPDPIGRPDEIYESCYLMIEEAVHRVLEWLETQKTHS